MPPFFAAAVRALVLAGAILGATVPVMDASAQDRYAQQRKTMVEEIARNARETSAQTGRAALSARVMTALAKVPRHRLVPPGRETQAYLDRPLPIGGGQTISQPFIVALMTDLLDLKPGDKVLEIGTGSGYQAAVLAEVGAHVFTVEIVEGLAREAARNLRDLGYTRIQTRIGDGYRGWPESAPFDAIMVTAAPSDIPPALTEQLKPGGKLVIPVGSQGGVQTLYVVEKGSDGALTRRAVLAVRFVPLTRGGGAP